MSKPKIFQQMEEAGSFQITKNNWRTITGNDIKAYFDKNIPVYFNSISETNNYKWLITSIETYGNNGFIMKGSYTKDNILYQCSLIFNDATAHMDDAQAIPCTITNKTGDTMEGSLLAKAGIANSRQMRNITLSTAEPSSGENGDVWIQYEE